MRLIHAVRELAARPAHRSRPSPSTPTSTAPPRSCARPTSPTTSVPRPHGPYLDLKVLERALVETGADAAWVGWGFVAEDPAFAELCEKVGVTFVGPSPDAMRKLGDKIGAKLIAEEVGVPVAPWSRGAVETLDAALDGGGPDRLPADAQGDRGRRRARHPGGPRRRPARRRLRAHQPGGRAGVRQRHRVPGAPGHRRPARRGPGDRRRPGHRVGARRPRLLGAAAQPEGHRGVGVAGAQPRAGRRAQGVGRAAGRRGRLPRRGDRRVPLPPRRRAVRVPRGQHPPAGRAPDHRVDHRVRPGQGAAARGVRRAGSRASRRSSAGTPSRPGSTPRTPTATSRPPRAASPGWTCRPGRASGWTPASARATPSRPTSTR